MSTALPLLVPVLSAWVTGACAVAVGARAAAVPGARAFSLTLLAQTWWSLAYVAELTADGLGAKLFWDNLQLPPPFLMTVALFVFTMEYTGRGPTRWRRVLLALSILPAVACLWVFTDPLHHLARAGARVVEHPPFGVLVYPFTTPELLAFLEMYLVGGYALFLILSTARRQAKMYRRQAVAVSLGTFLIMIAGVPMLLDYRLLGQRDSSPLWFGIGGLAVTWGLRRYQLFDLVPIARDAVIDHLPDAVVVLDASDRVIDVNPAARQLLPGKTMALGVSASDLFVDWPTLRSRLTTGMELGEVESPDQGRIFELRMAALLDAAGGRRGRSLTLRDVTARRHAEDLLRKSHGELEHRVAQRTEELSRSNDSLRLQMEETRRAQAQLHQAQKLESIGRLAGGIAHDFNNVLTIILGNVQLARLDRTRRDTVVECLADIEQATTSAAALTRQLLAFARRETIEPRVVDLNGIVRGARPLLSRVLGEDIELRLELTPHATPVFVDPGRMEQVLINLAVNARDAMPTGGTLAIRTEIVPGQTGGDAGVGGAGGVPAADHGFSAAAGQLDAEAEAVTAAAVRARAATERILLSVRDTGTGIDPHVVPHVFEPFFTTKAHGRGTGLGLSMVYGTVQQAGGDIQVASTPGTGTTFLLYLPASTAPVTATVVPADPEICTGSGTIALIEDQSLVRATTRRELERLGYRVVDFASAEEALAGLTGRLEELDLVLTDVVLAGASGRHLAEKLVALRPGLPVVLMSGYTDDVVIRHGVERSSMTLLDKPFELAVLAQTVRRALVSKPRA